MLNISPEAGISCLFILRILLLVHRYVRYQLIA